MKSRGNCNRRAGFTCTESLASQQWAISRGRNTIPCKAAPPGLGRVNVEYQMALLAVQEATDMILKWRWQPDLLLSYSDCSWADTEEGSYRNVAASIILKRAMKCFMKYWDLWNLWVKHWQQPTGLSYRQLFCYTSQDHVPLSCVCPGHTGRVQDSCSSPDNTTSASVFLWGTGFFKCRQLSIICAFHWAGKPWIVEETCMIWALGRALQ